MAIRLSLGARFRRQSLAPRGATLAGFGGLTAQRSQAELRCQMMNANGLVQGFSSNVATHISGDIKLSEEEGVRHINNNTACIAPAVRSRWGTPESSR